MTVIGAPMTDARDPAVGDPVLIRGRIVGIAEGVASVEVYRSWPLKHLVPVQCGALELDEVADSDDATGTSEALTGGGRL